MEQLSPEAKELLTCLDKKEKLVAMIAPSFPIAFEYPQIVGQLKRLGFAHVFEVSRGAAETNCQVLDSMKKNSKARIIASPCPTIVRLIRQKYPHLVQFLSKADSPMSATAKLILAKYPDYKVVFIGPCPAKKLEAREDRKDLNILAITYIELQQIFKTKGIEPDKNDVLAGFDLIGSQTRLYPISGGLSQSSGLVDKLTDEELDVISGLKNVNQSLDSFSKNRLKFLDILFCDGGCINGPGIKSDLNSEERRKKIINHWAKIVK